MNKVSSKHWSENDGGELANLGKDLEEGAAWEAAGPVVVTGNWCSDNWKLPVTTSLPVSKSEPFHSSSLTGSY